MRHTKGYSPLARGVRVSAAAEAGRVILDWDHALDPDENHKRAAKALAFKLNWNGDYVGGHLPQKNAHHMCFVRQDRGISPEFTIAER